MASTSAPKVDEANRLVILVPGLSPTLAFAIQSVLALGLRISISPSMKYLGVSFAPLGSHSSMCSRVWQIDEAKVEDRWTAIKGKKIKSSIPPLDMNLRSYKGGSKSKCKS